MFSVGGLGVRCAVSSGGVGGVGVVVVVVVVVVVGGGGGGGFKVGEVKGEVD